MVNMVSTLSMNPPSCSEVCFASTKYVTAKVSKGKIAE